MEYNTDVGSENPYASVQKWKQMLNWLAASELNGCARDKSKTGNEHI
jgi:hypothetical protein